MLHVNNADNDNSGKALIRSGRMGIIAIERMSSGKVHEFVSSGAGYPIAEGISKSRIFVARPKMQCKFPLRAAITLESI